MGGAGSLGKNFLAEASNSSERVKALESVNRVLAGEGTGGEHGRPSQTTAEPEEEAREPARFPPLGGRKPRGFSLGHPAGGDLSLWMTTMILLNTKVC